MLNDKIRELKLSYQKLFDEQVYKQSYIEIDGGDEVVLSANREGLLLLVEEIITLCEKGQSGCHYHLDEAGMASKCNKPLVFQLIDTPC